MPDHSLPSLSGSLDPRMEVIQKLLDQQVERRSTLLPLVQMKSGKTRPGIPQIFVDALKSLMLPGAVAKGYNPTFEDTAQMSMDTMMAGGLLGRAPAGALGANVWHGGPNKWAPEPGFPQGRPRLDKVGTGEGAQAYGHGFYSADVKGVGQGYKNRLEKGDFLVRKNGTTIATGQTDPSGIFASYAKGYGDLDEAAKGLQKQITEVEEGTNIIQTMRNPAAPAKIAEIQSNNKAALDWYTQNRDDLVIKRGEGALYNLDLPDEDIAKMLDWDAPLSEQPHILQAVEDTWGDPDIVLQQLGLEPKSVTGEQFLQALEGLGQHSKVAAAEALRKAGVPGNKYYDQMSRAGATKVVPYGDSFQVQMPNGKGRLFKTRAEADEYLKSGVGQTRNYVTWDQDVLDRTKIISGGMD